MIYDSKTAETHALLDIANKMCVAARTAPKARGHDHIHTCVITGDDLMRIADEMDRIGEQHGVSALFSRDAQNVRVSTALVMIGSVYAQRGVKFCGYCGFVNCAECAKNEGICVYDNIDLGIALGSAAAIAADNRADNRILYTAGRAALSLGLMDESVRIAIGIPICALGKSPYFDRRVK
ncbi:MAG: ferredoxin domain-containing protein [Bacillota bacterium]